MSTTDPIKTRTRKKRAVPRVRSLSAWLMTDQNDAGSYELVVLARNYRDAFQKTKPHFKLRKMSMQECVDRMQELPEPLLEFYPGPATTEAIQPAVGTTFANGGIPSAV